jgi:hypothetical protein
VLYVVGGRAVKLAAANLAGTFGVVPPVGERRRVAAALPLVEAADAAATKLLLRNDAETGRACSRADALARRADGRAVPQNPPGLYNFWDIGVHTAVGKDGQVG